jgi:hypothetical protein
MAVLMPTSAPLASTSAPPELPGLMAASVWMKFWNASAGLVAVERADDAGGHRLADVEGVADGQHGVAHLQRAHIAQRHDRQPARSIFSTAMSVSGSLPTSRGGVLRPSASCTSMSVAPSTTWWLVSR